MEILAKVLIGIVALEHLYILWLEMFAWTTVGKKVFRGVGSSDNFFEETKTMAANQGLYNGFLAAGLIWALLIQNPEWSKNVAMFFLACVVVAGLYGGLTATKAIIYKQALPAIIALIAVWFFL